LPGLRGFDWIFEEEQSIGQLYVADLSADRIIKHVELYNDSTVDCGPDESDSHKPGTPVERCCRPKGVYLGALMGGASFALAPY